MTFYSIRQLHSVTWMGCETPVKHWFLHQTLAFHFYYLNKKHDMIIHNSHNGGSWVHCLSFEKPFPKLVLRVCQVRRSWLNCSHCCVNRAQGMFCFRWRLWRLIVHHKYFVVTFSLTGNFKKNCKRSTYKLGKIMYWHLFIYLCTNNTFSMHYRH